MMELKPCPFCGSSNLSVVIDYKNDENYVTCKDCEASGPHYPGWDVGAEMWSKCPHRVPTLEKIKRVISERATQLWNKRPDLREAR